MRELTLKGFLTSYLFGLSQFQTINIHKLYDEMQNNHRLKEPLFLYCHFLNKQHILFKYLNVSEKTEYDKIMLEYQETGLDNLPNDYKKVFHSFECERKRMNRDLTLKNTIYNKVIEQQAIKNISNSEIYKSLKLNPSNVNSFLKYKNLSKLSLKNVKMIYDFVKMY